MFSIVWLFFLGIAFPHEIVWVIFLSVPSGLWVCDVIAPAHLVAVVNSWWKWTAYHLNLALCVCASTSPVHKGTLVHASILEFNNPMFANIFVCGMVVHVLFLWVIDSSDLVLCVFVLPNGCLNVGSTTCCLIKLRSLVQSHFVCVYLWRNSVSFRNDTLSLNGTID